MRGSEVAPRTLGRREFLKLSGLAAIGPCFAPLMGASPPEIPEAGAFHVLRIRMARVELAPGHLFTTTTYNGRFPGPLLRAAVGERVLVDVYNETDTPERVNWHGLDTAFEDTSAVPAYSRRRMEFTPTRSGLYFYHSGMIAAASLHTGLYSGQAGALLVEPRNQPGCHDRELVAVLGDSEPFVRRTRRGCEVGYTSSTINGRMLGHGDPLRVNAGDRVLFQVLNASASEPHSLALPGHSFEVIALDGNPVPKPATVPVLHLCPAERVSAVVEMNQPGIWILGEPADDDRHRGMGLIVEYAGCTGEPGWAKPARSTWDYARFGTGIPAEPDGTLKMVLTRNDAARSGFNRWSINGRSFLPTNTRPMFEVRRGARYRVKVSNTSDEIIPIHLQRHRLEIASIAGTPTAGVLKDVVAIGAHQQMEVDFVADNRGPALFHCSRQFHKDFGLMARVDYT